MRVVVLKLTSCMGCEFEILNLGKKFLDLTKIVNFEYFKLAKSGEVKECDVAFIEGAVSTQEEAELVKRIREKAKLLIALGSCSMLGGISVQRNYLPQSEKVKLEIKRDASPLKNYVKVDYGLSGCPIIGEEFERVIKDLLAGKILRERNFPVCDECKKAEIECLLKKGKACAGPITQGGCGAICPLNKVACNGCRGIFTGAEIESWLETLKEYGIKKEVAQEILRLFGD